MSAFADWFARSPRFASMLGRASGPFNALRARLGRRIFRWRGAESGSIELVQRRIFILPSRHGLIYVAALMLMLAGAVNYNLSLGFVLTFLLASLGVTSILHTYRNLARLIISPGRVQPVYAGDKARFTLSINNPTLLDRFSIGVVRNREDEVYTDVPARETVGVTISVAAPRRGVLMPGRLKLFTEYPLGLCHAWAYAQPAVRCIVYPRPEAAPVPLPVSLADAGSGMTHGAGQEDFAGLRPYHPGDSPRHVAWKAAARGQRLLTKQFSGQTDAQLWLDWRSTPDVLGVEGRLSRLARWVTDAHASALSFGLRLPGVTIAPQSGMAQRDKCLEALALFRIDVQPA